MIIGFISALVLIGLMFGSLFCLKGKMKLVGAALAALALVIVPPGFKTVQTGEVTVVKTFGEAKEVKDAGLYWNLWLTNSYENYDTKVRGIFIEDIAYSSDAQQMKYATSFQYQIQADKVLDITREFGSQKILDARIQSIVQEQSKSVMSKYKAMDIIENRSALSPEVKNAVKDILSQQYYVDVTNILITNIDFSDAFEAAVEEKMIAEQQQLKAEYEAKAKVVAAQATAEANALLERSLTDKILQEMYINKWDGKLPQVVSDESTLFQIPTNN